MTIVLAPAVHDRAGAVAPVAASTALTAGPRQMAEPAVAVDPRDERRIAVAADPYLGPVRIRVTTSTDGGASWTPPVDVVPPGFAKSYDPTLHFDRDGNLLVVGGASAVGPPRCQPGSAIFVATVGGGAATYTIVRDARADGAYVDRPQSGYDARRHRLYIDWTESSDPGAECRGTPLRSHIAFTAATPGEPFPAPRPLPSSGLPAPFGAPIAVGPRGDVVVVVGEHDPGRRSRAVVVRSRDRGTTFGPAEIALETPWAPASLPAVGGFVGPTPSVAIAPDGTVTAAWSAPREGGAVPVLGQSDAPGAWTPVDAPADVAGVELFAEVAYDHDGRLWLLSAQAVSGVMRFVARERTALGWSPPVVLAEGRAGRYLELGEALALAFTRKELVAVVPVDSPSGSQLVVARDRLPAPPITTTTTSPTTSPASGADAPGATAAGRAGPPWPLITAGGAIVIVAAFVGRRRQVTNRRRRRARR